MEISCAYFLTKVRYVSTHEIPGILRIELQSGSLCLHDVPQPIIQAFIDHYGDANAKTDTEPKPELEPV